jgi:hypothetical protein
VEDLEAPTLARVQATVKLAKPDDIELPSEPPVPVTADPGGTGSFERPSSGSARLVPQPDPALESEALDDPPARD